MTVVAVIHQPSSFEQWNRIVSSHEGMNRIYLIERKKELRVTLILFSRPETRAYMRFYGVAAACVSPGCLCNSLAHGLQRRSARHNAAVVLQHYDIKRVTAADGIACSPS